MIAANGDFARSRRRQFRIGMRPSRRRARGRADGVEPAFTDGAGDRFTLPTAGI